MEERKLRVLFPFIEAGMGHIMPMKSVLEVFKRKYGDRVNVIESKFYTESNDPDLIAFEEFLTREVRRYGKSRIYGYWATLNCQFWGKQ